MDAFWKEHRYTADRFLTADLPDGRFELMDGYIYDMSPSPGFVHQRIVTELSRRIGNYIEKNKGNCTVIVAPMDVKLNDDYVVQPDVFVLCDKTKIEKNRVNGAPDWIIEILAPSNRRHDLIDKLHLYSDTGVREYWIVDPEQERVLVYDLAAPNLTGLYTFGDEIPVGIYKDSPDQLVIRVDKNVD